MLLTLLSFTLWSGLPHAWIIECFRHELARILIERKFIQLDPHPVKQPPAPKSSNFDLKVAEAAGFHRAMNLWNETCGFGPLLMSPGVKGALSAHASILGGLLRNCQVYINEPSSFPSKFKDQSAESGNPYRLVRAHDEAENEALTFSYYDVYMEMVC
ncbi:hypothetical protein BKA58DRAFT_441276 [Alternaria rosae]|uniref:uncharacterized protein n=1 Tax=Alternaria rosae TaxID=1187941 RepID=UPI001E8E4447|nr:uncharacterized protein BKA58DRAFT_441276 [Alternaria rosae]KAH6868852.1 hypothetical protein BKA58DRAFT_441276 [Alternaria rosae]